MQVRTRAGVTETRSSRVYGITNLSGIRVCKAC